MGQSTPHIAQSNITSKFKSNSTSKSKSKVKPKKARKKAQRRKRMAAMALSNYKRRMQQQQLMQKEESSSKNFNFNEQQQSTQSSSGSDQGCFTSSQPTTNFTNGEGGNPNGTKKWSCDADGVTINTKWFPSSSSTSRTTRRLSFSGQEFLSAWGQD